MLIPLTDTPLPPPPLFFLEKALGGLSGPPSPLSLFFARGAGARGGAGGDVGGGAGGGVGGVVGRVGARDRDAADRHRLAAAHVLVAEQSAGVAVGHVVAADLVVRQGHRGRGGAVVDLVDAGGADGQG